MAENYLTCIQSNGSLIKWKPYNKKIFSYEPPLRVLFAKYRGYYHAIANSKGLMEAFGWAAEAINFLSPGSDSPRHVAGQLERTPRVFGLIKIDKNLSASPRPYIIFPSGYTP